MGWGGIGERGSPLWLRDPLDRADGFMTAGSRRQHCRGACPLSISWPPRSVPRVLSVVLFFHWSACLFFPFSGVPRRARAAAPAPLAGASAKSDFVFCLERQRRTEMRDPPGRLFLSGAAEQKVHQIPPSPPPQQTTANQCEVEEADSVLCLARERHRSNDSGDTRSVRVLTRIARACHCLSCAPLLGGGGVGRWGLAWQACQVGHSPLTGPPPLPPPSPPLYKPVALTPAAAFWGAPLLLARGGLSGTPPSSRSHPSPTR